MYSPFFDSYGKPLTIEKIKYEHLSQLVDCDEGHHLEFKLLLKDDEKAQLAKEIASFANCEGGWLIIGIDDKTKDIKPIDKKDYSQKIGKIATRISPMPEFDTRFLTCPNDKTVGVLVVYVYEGNNTPYICNGSVYVRSGSSKEPIKPADRGNIEYLYEKSNAYRKRIEDFCQRDSFYAYNNILQQKVTYPIANIYLKNISAKKDTFFNLYANRDKFINYVQEKYSIFKSVAYSMDSIIFKQRNILPSTNSATYIFEIFYDWSCKISVPLGVSEGLEKEEFVGALESVGVDYETAQNFRIANGSTLFNSMFFGTMLFSDIAKKYRLKEKNYAFCVEIENAGESVAVFYGEKYKEYVKNYGLPYAHKEINKSSVHFLKDYPKLTFEKLPGSLIADDLGAALGFRSDSIFEIMQDSNKKYEE